MNVWLARFAKFVVVATFVLIFVGGHTTTTGAGMAFPDWPLSRGSVNPPGWWKDSAELLEHSHRYVAEGVGLLIGILCAWVWQRLWAVPVAIAGSGLLAGLAMVAGAPRSVVAHVGLWGSAAIFVVLLLSRLPRRVHLYSVTVRWLAFTAYVGVCIQAVLGGLRVTTETSGLFVSATAFRVLHGCFAQLELCLLVALAAMLSAKWRPTAQQRNLGALPVLSWIAAAALFLQLIAGATMRHLGAGLAIPTFPHATPQGSWWPASESVLVALNFAHTRVGAVLAGVLILVVAVRALRAESGDSHLSRPAGLAAALLIAQVAMGVFVIWSSRPPILTTLHVVNGAALLAATVLLAVRASWSHDSRTSIPAVEPELASARP